MFNPLRLTLFLFLFPRRFTREAYDWSDFRITDYNDRFAWRADGWNGLRDQVKDPVETYEDGRGDCEDYAVVIASALLSETDWPVHLTYLWGPNYTHVVCHTNDIVYSSGERHSQTIDEYQAETSYTRRFTRTLRV